MKYPIILCTAPAKHSSFKTVWVCCSLDEETLGPNVCYVKLMMEGFRGPIHCHKHKGTTFKASCGLQTSSVTPVKTWLQNNNPLELPACPSSGQVATRHSRDLKQQCQHLSNCWNAVKRVRRWPDNNQGTETIPSQAWVKNKIRSCVIDSDHS